jgi:hypothetical protein
MTDAELIRALEERSRLNPDRVIRLKGVAGDDPFELLIFRGFSSSTSHATAFDPDLSVLPDGTRLVHAELLKGPLTPGEESVLAGPLAPEVLLAQASW